MTNPAADNEDMLALGLHYYRDLCTRFGGSTRALCVQQAGFCLCTFRDIKQWKLLFAFCKIDGQRGFMYITAWFCSFRGFRMFGRGVI